MARVVIDARESGTSTGRYVDKLIENLHQLKPGFEIVVLTKTPRIAFIKQLAPGFEVVESNFPEFTFAEQLGFKSQIKKLKPDLVHFTMTQQPVSYRGKVITTIHDLTTARERNPAKNRLVYTLKQRVYRWVIKKVAKKSQILLTPSQFVKDDVAQYANVSHEKIIVTYEAADKITAKPEPLAQAIVGKAFLLYVGRPTPHKNLQRAVDAFAIVKNSHPNLQFVLAGKFDTNYQLLKDYAAQRSIKGLVFTDFVSEGQLRWLYENAKLYVFASTSEGFGLPGLEAMAHGLPVAAAQASCLPEVYKGGALYFDPSSNEDIAAKITQVLDEPKLAADLKTKGVQVAAGYSWRRMAAQTLEAYQKVLNT
jgi:glycosyltransferase involved in cell wall biosynthesis